LKTRDTTAKRDGSEVILSCAGNPALRTRTGVGLASHTSAEPLQGPWACSLICRAAGAIAR